MPGLLEQADGAVDGGDRDLGVDRGGALVERLDVGVILGLAQDARDGPALLGDAQALVGAQLFDVDLAVHGSWIRSAAASKSSRHPGARRGIHFSLIRQEEVDPGPGPG